MAAPALPLRALVGATKPRVPAASGGAASSPWTCPSLAGRLVEVSGAAATAALTFAALLVLDAQRRGERAAWVTSRESTFFPPDAAAAGVDLASLPVVRVPRPGDVARAGERLVRSGAFDVVVLDLAAGATVPLPLLTVPLPLLTRLLGLAEKHGTAVVFLTQRPATAPSLGSVVSLRAEARRTRLGDGAFACELVALRDRRQPAGWTHSVTRRGPDGVR